jgi:hypothetical protein
MTRLLSLCSVSVLLAICTSACGTTDRQTYASSGSAVYPSGALGEALPDPYHYRCTGECLGL